MKAIYFWKKNKPNTKALLIWGRARKNWDLECVAQVGPFQKQVPSWQDIIWLSRTVVARRGFAFPLQHRCLKVCLTDDTLVLSRYDAKTVSRSRLWHKGAAVKSYCEWFFITQVSQCNAERWVTQPKILLSGGPPLTSHYALFSCTYAAAADI